MDLPLYYGVLKICFICFFNYLQFSIELVLLFICYLCISRIRYFIFPLTLDRKIGNHAYIKRCSGCVFTSMDLDL